MSNRLRHHLRIPVIWCSRPGALIRRNGSDWARFRPDWQGVFGSLNGNDEVCVLRYEISRRSRRRRWCGICITLGAQFLDMWTRRAPETENSVLKMALTPTDRWPSPSSVGINRATPAVLYVGGRSRILSIASAHCLFLPCQLLCCE